MSDPNDPRPLIELARETVRDVCRIEVGRSMHVAAAYVAGYEDAEASVHRDGVRDYSGALTIANARIAELEAQLAASEKCGEDRTVGVVAEMPPEFASWLKREMPQNTVIANPDWWAPRIWKAAIRTARTVPLKSVEPVG